MKNKILNLLLISITVAFIIKPTFAAEIKFPHKINMQENYITNLNWPLQPDQVVRKSYFDYLLNTTFKGKVKQPGNGETQPYEAGMPWPDPRFIDNGDGTVTDLLAGLMWVANGDEVPSQGFNTAVTACDALVFAGYDDWRLPTFPELHKTFANYAKLPCMNWLNSSATPFYNIHTGGGHQQNWSSTTDPSNAGNGLILDTYDSWVYIYSKSYSLNVSPVRSIHGFEPRCRPLASGQTNVYQAGDNGTYQAGVPITNADRFIVHSFSGTESNILDIVTGIIWTKNANPDGSKNWNDANSYCDNLSYGGHSDWRLPTVTELLSLVDYGQQLPCLPPDNSFDNVVQIGTWTSTTLGGGASVEAVRFDNSAYRCIEYGKTDVKAVWPVRVAY